MTTSTSWTDLVLRTVDRLSLRQWLASWLALVGCAGLAFWAAPILGVTGLARDGTPIPRDLAGLGDAIYFSFVTATSVGYGDIVPFGFVRLVAALESAAGLLLFGAVIAKLVSRKQEALVKEIHSLTFEERLGRVQTSLHLLIVDMQSLARLCHESAIDPQQARTRIASLTRVLAGELRTVHGLLFRPSLAIDEQVLESILATLSSALQELGDLLSSTAEDELDALQLRARRTLARLAEEICGECVPAQHTPELRAWMDSVRVAAKRL